MAITFRTPTYDTAFYQLTHLRPAYEVYWKEFEEEGKVEKGTWQLWTGCAAICLERHFAGAFDEGKELAQLVEDFLEFGDATVQEVTIVCFLEALINSLSHRSLEDRKFLGIFGPRARKAINAYLKSYGASERY